MLSKGLVHALKYSRDLTYTFVLRRRCQRINAKTLGAHFIVFRGMV